MPLDRSKILAHLGLALVTYIPPPLYVLDVVIREPETAVATFTSGYVVGYFATMMTFYGGPLVLIAIVISVLGLVMRKHVRINGATLACCLGWFAAAYWVMVNFR